MRQILTILVLLLTTQQAMALSGRGILQDIREQYLEQACWQLEFEHEFIWTMAADTVIHRGRMLTGPEGAFRVDLEGSHLHSDGASLWRWEEAGGQVLVETLGDSPDVILPHQLLISLEDRFAPGELVKQDKKNVELELKPRTDSEFMQRVRLFLSKEGKQWWPREIRFEDLGENLHRYRVLSRSGMPVFTGELEGVLDLELPVSFEIIDLRNAEAPTRP